MLKDKKLYRSSNDKMLSGVCAGIANFFGIDPTIVRVIYAILSLITSGVPGVVLYIVLAVIMPEDNGMIDADATVQDEKTDE